MLYNYPLQVRAKVLAIAPQISVIDASGMEILYIEQKIFALREAVKIYNNQKEKKQIYSIKTKQIIDFGAQYYFYKNSDEASAFGSIKEKGLRSLFKATYVIYDKSGTELFTISETNPWISLTDSVLSMIPYAGFLTGYFLHPSYEIIDILTNKKVITLKKEASFFERQFRIDAVDNNLSSEMEIMSLLGILMMIQLQKNRG